ncbi:MAG: hypothetical protein Fues2KO_18970 [Fuerstiella sp.]
MKSHPQAACCIKSDYQRELQSSLAPVELCTDTSPARWFRKEVRYVNGRHSANSRDPVGAATLVLDCNQQAIWRDSRRSIECEFAR